MRHPAKPQALNHNLETRSSRRTAKAAEVASSLILRRSSGNKGYLFKFFRTSTYVYVGFRVAGVTTDSPDTNPRSKELAGIWSASQQESSWNQTLSVTFQDSQMKCFIQFSCQAQIQTKSQIPAPLIPYLTSNPTATEITFSEHLLHFLARTSQACWQLATPGGVAPGNHRSILQAQRTVVFLAKQGYPGRYMLPIRASQRFLP